MLRPSERCEDAGAPQGPVAARKPFDDVMEPTLRRPPGVIYEADTVGACRAGGPAPQTLALRVVLYLHGGWYVWGSALAYRSFVGQIAARAGVATFAPDYRLAPEHLFRLRWSTRRRATAGSSSAACGGSPLPAIQQEGAWRWCCCRSPRRRRQPADGARSEPWSSSPVTDMTACRTQLEDRAAAEPVLHSPPGRRSAPCLSGRTRPGGSTSAARRKSLPGICDQDFGV